MIRTKKFWETAAVLTLSMTSFTVAQVMEITRSTIDGGGVLRSTGGEFELSGTIGQADAGILNGGEFTLNGGFWFELAAGDCNDDGTVGLLDHYDFTACLAGPSAAVSMGCECFDVDANGAVDLADFAVTTASP